VFRRIIELSQKPHDASKSPFENDLGFIFDPKDIEKINNQNSLLNSLVSQNVKQSKTKKKSLKNQQNAPYFSTIPQEIIDQKVDMGRQRYLYKKKKRPTHTNSISTSAALFNGIVYQNEPNMRTSSKFSKKSHQD